MSSIPVNNNLNVLANIVNQASAISDSRNALNDRMGEAVKDSFDMVMSRVSSKAETVTGAQSAVSSKLSTAMDAKSAGVSAAESSNEGRLDNKDTDSLSKSVKGDDAKQTDEVSKQPDETASDKEISENKNVSDKTDADAEVVAEDKAVVEEAGEKLVGDIARELGIDIDEVLKAMEILGLSAVQLFDPENMKQLLITLSGGGDDLSIVTNAELYDGLQNLLSMVSESLEDLKTQVGLTDEELNKLIADMAVVNNVSEDENNIQSELVEAADDEPEIDLEGMKDYAVTVHREGETVKVKVKVDDLSGEQSSKEEVTAARETQTKSENKPDNRNLFEGGRDENKGEAYYSGNFTAHTATEQINFNEIPNQPVVERYVSTEDIMNQIMEFMKISLKEDVQELEMHLHPASLGNVHVQIAAREGMVTAQFIAQNETVKAAIESQLVQLKNQFDEQGIKVDEVEVAVGDYRFEHSFAGEEENNGQNAENGKKPRRNINLSELDPDELPEDMDDSERIAAEMMAQSGNMIDYTA